jgi:very-short-patch-repair endonuclease
MSCENRRFILCGKEECTICYDRSFASHPCSSCWSDKNLVKPYEVFLSANKKYYFECNECNHELHMSLNKVSAGQWCKFCNSNGLCNNESCNMCFEKSFASHPRSINWSDKNKEKPIEVSKNSNKKYLFNCDECKHELEISLNNIGQGVWCKHCNTGVLCNDTNCKGCFERSFASHPMAACWSLKNALSSREVSKGSEKKCWFLCKDCNHEYDSIPYSIKKDKHCPYCSNQILCNNDECIVCFNKSCASSHKIKNEWSSLNKKTPIQVFLQSNGKVWFDCKICNHSYNSRPGKYFNNDGCCPFCANLKLCEDNECLTCFNKSFASHPKAACLNYKNDINSRMTFKGSEKRATFNCDKCKMEFTSMLYNVLSGYWCPFCKNKTEGKVMEFLQSIYPDCKRQLRFDWCRFSQTNNIMPIDFGLANQMIVIELDGEQHFNQVSNWTSPELTQAKDIEKMKKCIEEGYSLIRIYQLDVWYNKYDWKTVLQNAINELKDAEAQIIFISSNDCYNAYLDKLSDSIKYKKINPLL